LLAIVIGISKSLFNTDLISLFGDPVAFKIFFNCSFYFNFENKKNQIKVIAFKLNIIPRNI